MYYLLFIILYPVSLLPLGVLYRLADLSCFILYHIAGYRKEVVLDNLRHAFPEKSEEELRSITGAFYHSFCDQWIETLKLLSMSKTEINRRVKGNWEVFQKLAEGQKNTYALLGHQFNWEWANLACQHNAPQQFAGVYLPLESKAMDRILQYIRTRYGGWLISMKAQKSGFKKLEGVQYIVGLIADQNPSVTEVAEWLPFMHREAPFFRGPEQLARRAGAAVVFVGIKKTGRGHYEINLEEYASDASKTAKGNILNAYVHFLETQLREQPENYLWTHRRWKYVRKQ